MKPFKTHRQQLRILRSRGLTINDGSKAMRIFENENYYNVVNGYKDLFLVRDPNGNVIQPERYINGATLEEIHTLFSFDHQMRNVLLNELLKFERSIKSKISYRFSERHKQPNAYLNMLNFSRNPDKLKKILKLITIISNEISKQSDKNNSIEHYLDRHDGVPLWVLVKYLTLGNIQNFYECMDSSTQNRIARDFAESFRCNYQRPIHLTAETLINILKTATLFRNVCAHGERLYNFKLFRPARSVHISNAIRIPINQLDKGNVFAMVAFLKLVTERKDHKALIKNLRSLFNQYSNKFSSVNFNTILATMGFNRNWEGYFN